MLHVQAHGIPQVQGNHRVARAGKFAKVRDANPNLPGWRLLVSTLAREAFGTQRMILGPVRMEVTFWIERPKSAPKTRDVWPLTRGGGDWDKLARAIGDSMVDAGVVKDDSQIVDAHIVKRYAVSRDLVKIHTPNHWEQPGADIYLEEISDDPTDMAWEWLDVASHDGTPG